VDNSIYNRCVATDPQHRKRKPTPSALIPIIDPILVEQAFIALGAVLDIYATEPRGAPWDPVQEERRLLWRTMCLLRRRGTSARSDSLRDPTQAIAKSRGLSYRESPLCDRPTKKGRPCRRALKFGRLACHNHATPDEKAITAQWQRAVHFPWPRVDGIDHSMLERVVRELAGVLG